LKLANAEQAIITESKVDYLVSEDHPDNQGKWAFFASLGYTGDTWEELDQALRDQHLTLDAEEVEKNRMG
jgi:hypothetical protein